MTNSQFYSLAFTSGAALIHESVDIAKLRLELCGWAEVRKVVLEENTLQARTVSTLKKLYGEISRRLKHLSREELVLLTSGARQEEQHLIWLAICRQYNFINDFSLEVIYVHFEQANYKLLLDDYDAFFNAKAEWHVNLDSITDQTKSKARQVLFKMMSECGLINERKEIVSQVLSSELKALITRRDSADMLLFPSKGN